MGELPAQLWSIDWDDDDGAADALREAAHGEVGLTDRIRGARGLSAQAELADRTVAGRVTAVHRDAVVLAAQDGQWLVRPAAVTAICLPVRAPVAPHGVERTAGLAVVRQWSGADVTVITAAGSAHHGRLAAPGADHVPLTAGDRQVLIAWEQIAAVRRGGPS